MMPNPRPLPPESRLTVLESKRELSGSQVRTFLRCRCECGNTREFFADNVFRGVTLSCGCLGRSRRRAANLVHGVSNRTKVYVSWIAMKRRCGDPNDASFKNYGGRGIRVAPEWESDFKAFHSHIKTMIPEGTEDIPAGLSIDRIDNERGYEPGNIRLADRFVQARNKRSNVLISIDGVTKTLTEWCRESGIKPPTAAARIKAGWDRVQAVTEPLRGRRQSSK